MTKNVVLAAVALSLAGCATLTSDAMTPVALSFSDGSSGSCQLTNKRGAWSAPLPATTMVRRSDDPLRYSCRSNDGRVTNGQMESTVGAKIVASAVFLDLGITDAITDKHREYPESFVIPLQGQAAGSNTLGMQDSWSETPAEPTPTMQDTWTRAPAEPETQDSWSQWPVSEPVKEE